MLVNYLTKLNINQKGLKLELLQPHSELDEGCVEVLQKLASNNTSLRKFHYEDSSVIEEDQQVLYNRVMSGIISKSENLKTLHLQLNHYTCERI